jgi:NADP-dependent 3-hydroxy acid dehydrogenase YdfG
VALEYLKRGYKVAVTGRHSELLAELNQPKDITFQKLTAINTTNWAEQEKILNVR